MRKKMIVANWKMNGTRETTAELLAKLARTLSPWAGVEVVICPPFVYLEQAQRLLEKTDLKWGGQNVHHIDQGAFTGEISAAMLRDFGCSYVIVGHSERRHEAGETDFLVAQKVLQACKCGLTPILCVGETRAERAAGSTNGVVLRQLEAVVLLAGISGFDGVVVAYEPVWAIGNGTPALPEEAQAVHKLIRCFISEKNDSIASRVPILYGGSVTSQNSQTFCSKPDVDGVLVGGASLKAEELISMVEQVA